MSRQLLRANRAAGEPRGRRGCEGDENTGSVTCVSLSIPLGHLFSRLFFRSRSRILPPSRESNQVRLYARFTTYGQWRGKRGRAAEERVTRKGDTEGRIAAEREERGDGGGGPRVHWRE